MNRNYVNRNPGDKLGFSRLGILYILNYLFVGISVNIISFKVITILIMQSPLIDLPT